MYFMQFPSGNYESNKLMEVMGIIKLIQILGRKKNNSNILFGKEKNELPQQPLSLGEETVEKRNVKRKKKKKKVCTLQTAAKGQILPVKCDNILTLVSRNWRSLRQHLMSRTC